MKVKRDYREFYDKLTPRNQARFREQVMHTLAWKSANSFYSLIRGDLAVSEPEESYLMNLFAEFYQRQIEAVQL